MEGDISSFWVDFVTVKGGISSVWIDVDLETVSAGDDRSSLKTSSLSCTNALFALSVPSGLSLYWLVFSVVI